MNGACVDRTAIVTGVTKRSDDLGRAELLIPNRPMMLRSTEHLGSIPLPVLGQDLLADCSR